MTRVGELWTSVDMYEYNFQTVSEQGATFVGTLIFEPLKYLQHLEIFDEICLQASHWDSGTPQCIHDWPEQPYMMSLQTDKETCTDVKNLIWLFKSNLRKIYYNTTYRQCTKKLKSGSTFLQRCFNSKSITLAVVQRSSCQFHGGWCSEVAIKSFINSSLHEFHWCNTKMYESAFCQ